MRARQGLGFPFDVVPGFWDALDAAARQNVVFTIKEVFDELKAGNTPSGEDDEAVFAWANERREIMVRPNDDTDTQTAVTTVLTAIATRVPVYKPAALEVFADAADVWVIAHALAHNHDVVSLEVRKPQSGKKVQVPDVCDLLGISCVTTMGLLRALGVRFGLG